ncbi:DNA polymerase III subunit delta [Tropicimonas sp. IMCC34043]|uniref:DNA polymerase III subunit delta n=1 Tax=Tropicimonas sp. IMCC34043 TaxID=2248760 RepID=UPI000E222080|nr:DNA polymerase III subunit delta [Tropicimonas sp. IMCC34043]
MKLSTRDAAAFFKRPDPSRPGVLIHGADAMRVALKRQDLIAALIGPQGEAEMRLARVAAADLRRDPAALLDALKAAGFFPGPRAVLVEDAGDGLTATFATALADWREGDAMIVATAGPLPARSKLRKLFEDAPRAYAAAIYDDPPDRAQIEAELTRAGMGAVSPAVMGDLESLGRALDPGDFRQTLEKIALYKLGDPAPLSADEVAALAPASIEAAVDELINSVADGQVDRVAGLMRRLDGQGEPAVGLVIALGRHFRTLHAAAADPGGPASGLSRQRPPVFGPRRDRMIRQAEAWRLRRLERALANLVDTDLALRSAGQTAPQMALVERLCVRLAMLRSARI